MVSTGNNSSYDLPLPQKSLQIKQDDKFFSRLLSKENNSSSFRVLYYGGSSAGAIPFRWESRPGTPKHTFSDTSLPPLTPPPSYHTSNSNKPTKSKHKKHCYYFSKPNYNNLLHTIFPRLMPKKSHESPLSSSTSLSSLRSFSSSFSVSSTPTNPKCLSRSFELDDEEEKEAFESPTSTLCFGATHHDHSSNGGFIRGCFRW